MSLQEPVLLVGFKYRHELSLSGTLRVGGGGSGGGGGVTHFGWSWLNTSALWDPLLY